jgi:carbonic anhydrase/acetyltransferase-like protein (isoleucine patch superfamily)
MIRKYRGVSPKIHSSVFIEETAQVIGNVAIGQDSSVWFQVVIRGDVHFIRIGQRTNIQDGSLLHVTRVKWPLILGNEITVGHGVTLHGCVIKDRCLIGMRATLLDGVEIGEECIIGAGALVTEGTIIPPRSLALGLPAKVVRSLTEEEIARIQQSAENYILLAKDYTKPTKATARTLRKRK